eukprot:g1966.t1
MASGDELRLHLQFLETTKNGQQVRQTVSQLFTATSCAAGAGSRQKQAPSTPSSSAVSRPPLVVQILDCCGAGVLPRTLSRVAAKVLVEVLEHTAFLAKSAAKKKSGNAEKCEAVEVDPQEDEKIPPALRLVRRFAHLLLQQYATCCLSWELFYRLRRVGGVRALEGLEAETLLCEAYGDANWASYGYAVLCCNVRLACLGGGRSAAIPIASSSSSSSAPANTRKNNAQAQLQLFSPNVKYGELLEGLLLTSAGHSDRDRSSDQAGSAYNNLHLATELVSQVERATKNASTESGGEVVGDHGGVGDRVGEDGPRLGPNAKAIASSYLYQLRLLLLKAHPSMELARKKLKLYRSAEPDIASFFLQQELAGLRYYVKFSLNLWLYWHHVLGFTLLDARRSFEQRILIHNELLGFVAREAAWLGEAGGSSCWIGDGCGDGREFRPGKGGAWAAKNAPRGGGNYAENNYSKGAPRNYRPSVVEQSDLAASFAFFKQRLEASRASFTDLATHGNRDYTQITWADVSAHMQRHAPMPLGPHDSMIPPPILPPPTLDGSKYLTIADFGYTLHVIGVEEALARVQLQVPKKQVDEENYVYVGFDTEWRPEFRKGGQGAASVMQLALPHRKEVFVIDLLFKPEEGVEQAEASSSSSFFAARLRFLREIFSLRESGNVIIVGFSLGSDTGSVDERLRQDFEDYCLSASCGDEGDHGGLRGDDDANLPREYDSRDTLAHMAYNSHGEQGNKQRAAGGPTPVAAKKKMVDILSDHIPRDPETRKKMSLAELAEKAYGKPLCKDITMLNWEVRPLEGIWCEYAALDAIVPVEYYLEHCVEVGGAVPAGDAAAAVS